MDTPQVIASDAELERFVEVPFALHASEPAFVPPLRAAELRALAGAAVPGGVVRTWVCARGGRDVGRVAALVNPRLLAPDGRPIGQVGYYECADDPVAARLLLDAALDALRQLGATAALGPMNGGAHRAHRLMTRGFERAPFLLEPRNPPWHVAHFLDAGFAPVHRWSTYELSRDELAALQRRLARMGERASAGGWRVDLPDVRGGRALLRRLHGLLDRSWAGHVGYAPLSEDELADSFEALLAVLPPDHVGILVDPRGADAGFGYLVPDLVAELRALGGDGRGWGRWAGAPLPARVVAHTVAVVPEARDGAAPALLVAAGLDAALAAGYRDAVLPLTTEGLRHWSRRHLATREHALFARGLNDGS